MTADETIELYKKIDALSTEDFTRLQKTFSGSKVTQLGSTKKGIQSVLFGQYDPQITKDFAKDILEDFGKYFSISESGEADAFRKLFGLFSDLSRVRFESQRTYNYSVRETSMLLNAEDSEYKKIIERVKEMSGLRGLKQPGVGSKTLESMLPNVLMPTNNIYKPGMTLPYKTQMAEISDFLKSGEIQATLFRTAIENLGGAFEGMFAGAKGGMKGMVTATLEASRTIINALLAQAIAGVIAGESKKGLLGLITASIGIAALTALWKTKVPEFANGALAYGPIVAQVGEYPGARRDPEVISPLSKLRDMIGGGQMMPQRVKMRVDVGGNMIAYFEYQRNKLNNYR
jgi:hypothetical protein